MNGKKAKELRRQPPPVEAHIQIFYHGGDSATVNGFPTNLTVAMHILQVAARVVAMHFCNEAREGRVDEKYNLEQSKIIKPKGILLN